jgi:hypothetical protein
MRFLLTGSVLVCCLYMFAQCRRKSQPLNIESWLEFSYPDRFQILQTNTADIIGNLSFSVKRTIIAESSNPLIQVKIMWDKREKDLALSRPKVDEAIAAAHRKYGDAQSLIDILKTSGLKDFSVSINEGVAMVLIFAEATRDHRQKTLTILEGCFAVWRKKQEYNVNISYVEPEVKGKDFEVYVPLIYWLQSESEFRKNNIYWTTCTYSETFSADKVSKKWVYNTDCDRFSTCLDDAQFHAETWARNNIKQPITISNLTKLDQTSPNINIINVKFPFTYSLDSLQEGHVSYSEEEGSIVLNYDVENKKIIGKLMLEKAVK